MRQDRRSHQRPARGTGRNRHRPSRGDAVRDRWHYQLAVGRYFVLACALALTGSCKKKMTAEQALHAKNRAPPRPTAPAKVTFDPAPTAADKLPPPEAGYVRLDSLELDVKGTKATSDGAVGTV